MYAALSPADFTDGGMARAAAERLRRAQPLSEDDLYNAFDRHIGKLAPRVAAAMALCSEAGVTAFAAGSGPGFFAPIALADVPTSLLQALERDCGVRAVACRTLGREAAMTVREV
jgi:4-diphosphocytidyl-2C-methyl-D-erythritol kinase